MLQYIALIHKAVGSDYGVSFPDFPGCITAGVTLDEARSMAEEAIAFHVKGIVQDGDALPEPSSLEAVMANRENRDGVAVWFPSRPKRRRPSGSTSRSRKTCWIASIDMQRPGD